MLQHGMTYHSDDVTLRLLSPFLAQRTLIALWLPHWFPDKALALGPYSRVDTAKCPSSC